MKIYIASSWKNQHAIEMLTDHLRAKGHQILSFVENSYGEQAGHFATEAVVNFKLCFRFLSSEQHDGRTHSKRSKEYGKGN